jgi:predicted  nucleic acid-binding Zn-ribbon protein
MARVDSAMAGVQERDKWAHRLEALERSLEELLERRRRLEVRMRRVHRELGKLERTSREYVEVHGRFPSGEAAIAARGPVLH